METRNFLKMVFIVSFVLMMILYAIFDDGGISTKTWYDFLFMPIPSFFFASCFTGIIYLLLSPFIWFKQKKRSEWFN